MSEFNINKNLKNDNEPEIKNKLSLDTEKIVDRTLISVLIVFCVILTILGIDIEKKLKVINEKAPVIITADATTSSIPASTSAIPSVQTTPPLTSAITTPLDETTAVLQQHSTETSSASSTHIHNSTSASTTQKIISTTNSTSATSETSEARTQEDTVALNTTTQKQTANPTTDKPQSDGKYYITASGSKYHISTCSYLSKTKIEIDLDEATEKGYTPCSRCIK